MAIKVCRQSILSSDPCSYCSALEALINFAYSGHVAIDQQNVQSLLIGSSFLQLQNVKDACCSFLQERWVTQICSSIGRVALECG